MAQPRNHNEWFRMVSCGGRKSCPNCKAKLGRKESIWSWGEYIRVKWNTVKYFCRNCYETEVMEPLLDHAGPCGCTITLVGYQGTPLPRWLRLIKRRPKACAMPTPVVNAPDTKPFDIVAALGMSH